MQDHDGQGHLELDDVATNNLQQIKVRFPLGQFTVVTGVSGSGKSSLVFDSLYGESYRRYLESLSSFARQYLKALPKPKIGQVRNLLPAIAVRQNRAGANKRSTVGTLTELNELLQILFTHLSVVHCRECGEVVVKDNARTISTWLAEHWQQEKAVILAPLEGWTSLKPKELKEHLEQQGFTRLFLDGELSPLADADLRRLKSYRVAIDRIVIDDDHHKRLLEALGLALKVGRSDMEVYSAAKGVRAFSSKMECNRCKISYREPATAFFSFNHPLGACQACQGYGQVAEIDWQKVVPDQQASLKDKGLAPLNFGEHASYYQEFYKSAKKRKFAITKPFADYTSKDWQWLKEGDEGFGGMQDYFTWLDTKKYKAHYRMHKAKYQRYVTCPTCQGSRYSQDTLTMRVKGVHIAAMGDKSINDLAAWFRDLDSNVATNTGGLAAGYERSMVDEAISEAQARIAYLQKIGLAYLSLNRTSNTLSGGELQRIHMARCLGSTLTDTLFCLDEPSAGLHARDSQALLELIYELREQGNTVVVVEHERSIIRGADHFIEIGPGAGHEGGKVVYAGTPSNGALRRPTLTLKAFSSPEPKASMILKLKGARTHNLQGIDVNFPLGQFIAVCGVSGSGKTSLIQHTLYPMLAQALGETADDYNSEPLADSLGPATALRSLASVRLVSQAPIGRSSRSNIITYLGIFDQVRKLLSQQEGAIKQGLAAGAFSFNVPGGRCETCRGLGTVVEDLSFLGEMAVICPTCNGERFKPEVLKVRYKGLNLIEILGLTVAQAREFFYDQKKMLPVLDEVMRMGLGYISLGQTTSSFSGGEAQRLKLLALLRDTTDLKPSFLIFDEPTTGLSDSDVTNFLAYLQQLVERGHTILVIEHHLAVLAAADYLIEIGPEAADKGGQLVYAGPPAALKGVAGSVTAAYL